jgi:transcription-repair coupling factor (superfamily II helicase)
MMQLDGILPALHHAPAFQALLARLAEGQSVHGLAVLRAARAFTLAALAESTRRPILYITARIDRAHNVAEQLPVWLANRHIIDRFAEPAAFFYERAPWGEANIQARLETLFALNTPSEMPLVIVTSARAIMQRTLPRARFQENTYMLRVGERHNIERLISTWLGIGYEAVSIVMAPGTFSRRGGILDIFPIASDNPFRIDFFDDEIDSLRAFSPQTQRSESPIESLTIAPAREALPQFTARAAEQLANWFEQLPLTANDPTSPRTDQELLTGSVAFPHLESYLPYLYDDPATLLNYLPQDALVIIEDQDELTAAFSDLEARAGESLAEKRADHRLPQDAPQPYVSWQPFSAVLKQHQVIDFGLGTLDNEPQSLNLRGLFAPESRYGGQLRAFLMQVRGLQDAGSTVIAISAQSPRLHDLWQETTTHTASFSDQNHTPLPHASVTFTEGTLQEGWRLRAADGDIHVFTDAEIFGWSRPEPRRRQLEQRRRAPTINTADLREGDYVVHIDYGVGRFAGMRRRTLESVEREYLMVEYAGTDAVYVPIHQTDRLTRYVGAEDHPPTLTKLGQPDWARVKSKAQKAVEEEAQELLALYAARASTDGHAYSDDTPWQHELEASFPFIETNDQLKAVRAVKADMEQPHPMDRLICGDVGYGKTEVAIRAAFKAVMDGKQVAILVPTTILAQQHHETFSRRMGAFPVSVESISRFRTRAEQTAILNRLRSGDVDIIIGTHRLLQEDVSFKSLGLVIIDEEQRFGVKHKEHLKSLRTQVDVLTLTATPIPRTLYMGLTGVRDISMIQTPPEERLPIITHVGTFDDRLVRSAIMREMERGGQIFVVHNRVQSIDQIREKLAHIAPEARIAIGHGQMDERLLQNVMETFGNGEYDILLATSIIENGLDIPNANTLIVDRADWFGVSQLYQLRGRVGRSAQQAYAYFFHPADNRLSDDARARLETLAEYTDLGAGYQIAMRDLELRGAGDILSTRQTGHVAAVGLHLYTQMLTQAVQGLKGTPVENQEQSVSESAIVIDLPVPAYLPEDYIPELGLRLNIYRRIGGLNTDEAVEAMRDELTDRFGTPPPAVVGMLFQIQVKLLALRLRATAIVQRSGRIEIRLPYLAQISRELLQLRLGRDVRVTRTAVEFPLEKERWQERLLNLMSRLAEDVRLGSGH